MSEQESKNTRGPSVEAVDVARPISSTSVGQRQEGAKKAFKTIIVKMPGREKKERKLLEVLGKPSNMLFLGTLLVALAYALYPFRASSMVPGILIGGGIAGLIWVAFRVIYR